MKRTSTASVVTAGGIVLALANLAFAQYTNNPPLQLAQNTSASSNGAAKQAAPAPKSDARSESSVITREEVTRTETETTTTAPDQDWDIFGPIRLRSADPEPLGEVELKFTSEWGTSSNGDHDRVSIEPEVEYGIAPNHELGIVTRLGLDGDSIGDNVAIGLTYVYVLNDVPHLGDKASCSTCK